MSNFIRNYQDSSSPVAGFSSPSLNAKSRILNGNSLQRAASYSVQSCPDDREKSLSQSLFATNGIPNGAGCLDGLENPVPLNLFQDSYDLKLSTLPSHDREMLEDLINKINYQINYFALDNKTQSNKVKLTCKLCCVTLRIAKVEKHVRDQEHLRNLTKRCKSDQKTAATPAISEKNWDFLDFEEIAQRYRCTLCNLNLSESRNSWNKHFQSVYHRKNLESLKSKNPANSICISSASGSSCNSNYSTSAHKEVSSIKPSNVPTSSAQTESNKNSFNVVAQFLSDQDKKILEAIKCELEECINYFEPSYENVSGKLYLFCKLCKVAILLKNVTSHIGTNEHRTKMMKDMCVKPSIAAEKDVPQSSALIEVNKKSNVVTESLNNDHSREVVEELTNKLRNYTNYFKPAHESGSKKPQFSCQICNIVLPPKNARLHIFSDTHLNNLRENCVSISAGKFPMQILNDVISQFHNKLYFFQLIYDMKSNGVYFVCKVCTLVLIAEDVKEHIYSSEHSENVQANPIVLQFESLNNFNKQIVSKTAAATKDRIRDFVFVYRIGTEELRFYCKYCHLTLIPQNVENHSKSSHHLEAVSAQSSQNYNPADNTNSEAQSFKTDTQSSATVSKTALNSMRPPETQNRSSVDDSFADIQKKFMETFKEDSNYKYFDLLHSADSNKFFFKCRLCDVTVKPTHVANHVQVGYHSKNVTLSSYFENFHSLKESSKKIIRRLFYEIGDKLNNFSLLPGVDDKKPQFWCKICNVSMSADFIVDHLQIKEHQKCASEEKRAKSANFRTSLQSFDSSSSLDSEPTIRRTVKSVTPVSASAEAHLATALSNLRKSTPTSSLESVRDPVQVDVRKYSKKTLKAGLIFQTSVNGTCFVCQDCNDIIPCTPVQNHGIFKETREKLFVNCRGKSAETALLNFKKSKASKSNNLDHETASPQIVNVYDTESKGTVSSGSSTASPINSAESDVNVLSSSNKEILKTLIDKIGMKINHFDFVLERSAHELRFRCKYCLVVLRSEAVGDHVNYQEHVKYSQLSNLPNFSFESLYDKDKRRVKKLFDKMGSEIKNVDIKLSFVCKICGVDVRTETVVSHMKSEEHLKHLTGHSSRDDKATDVCNIKSSQVLNDFVNLNVNRAQETFSPSDAPCSVPQETCQSANDSNRRSVKSCDEVQERKLGDRVTETSGDIHLSKAAAGEKLWVGSKVSPSMSVKSNHLPRKAQENPVSCAESSATTFNAAKTSYVLRKPAIYNNLTSSVRENNVRASTTHQPPFPGELRSVQNSGFLEGDNCHSSQMNRHTVINTESEYSTAQREDSHSAPGLFTSESSEIFLCCVCHLTVSSKDIKTHVSSEGHTVSLTLPDLIDFKVFQDYYTNLVKKFTGLLRDDMNRFEILYELPGSKLRFYCKLCSLMIRAEFLEDHVNHIHLNNLPRDDRRYSLASESESQPFKEFLCEPCNNFVYFKDVANHVSSVSHSVSLLSVRSFLKFSSFLPYKDRVLETLAHSKSKKTSDFEFFVKLQSSKFYVFCKPCELLLQPEYVDPHIGHPQHGQNSMIMEQWNNSYGPYQRSVYASEKDVTRNLPSSSVNTSSDRCSVM